MRGGAVPAAPIATTIMSNGKTAKERYDAKTAVYVSLKLNKGTDEDILAKLANVSSKQGYIKALIRANIANEKKQ